MNKIKMKNKIFFVIIILVGVILLGYSAFAVFHSSSNKKPVVPGESAKPAIPPEMDELMSIIKKSPVYPDFVKLVKTEDFGPELIDYYNFSPQVYAEKKAEWEKNSSRDTSLEKPFDTIKLNENSFFVRLKSKANPKYGLTAIVDMSKQEPQILVINMQIDVSAGM